MAIEMQFMVRVEPVLSVRLGHDWPGGRPLPVSQARNLQHHFGTLCRGALYPWLSRVRLRISGE